MTPHKKKLHPEKGHHPDASTVPGAGVYTLSYDLLEFITTALADLVSQTRVRCGLVLDRTGCIMASEGDFRPITPSTLGATAAAVLAALKSMVSRTNSNEITVSFSGGGDIDRIHFTLIDERLALCVLYSSRATSSSIHEASKEFAKSVRATIETDQLEDRTEENAEVLKSVNYIETKLDELFKDFQG